MRILPDELRDQIAAELNVGAGGWCVAGRGRSWSTTGQAQFRALGRRFGPRTPAVAAGIDDRARSGHRPRHAGGRERHGRWSTVSGVLGPDDVIVTQTPRAGWAVATDNGETVAIDIAVTPELRREGLARELSGWSRMPARPTACDVTDRISLRWSADRSRTGRGADRARRS